MRRDLKNIAMSANAQYRDLQISLAQYLKSQFDCQIHLYVNGHPAIKYFEDRAPSDLFSTITVNIHGLPLEFSDNLDASEIEPKAQYFEKRYGRAYNSFAVDDRHFGRGFAPGGFHHPRSRQSETSSYLQFLDTYNNVFEFWEAEFEDKKLDLFIDGGLKVEAVAMVHGAISRRPSSARFENLFYWISDKYGFSPEFEKVFQAQEKSDEVAIVSKMPFTQYEINKKAQRGQLFFGMVKKCILQIRAHAYYHYKRSPKRKRYYLSSELKFIYRVWRDFRYLTKHHRTRLADLKDRRFAFYPLHVEPEVALQSRSPEYFYQLSAIISISRDLPAGVVLAVKEHIPAIGRRPDRFYEQIAELKNVVIIDPRETGLDMISQADLVVTITGTAGQEAAIRGTPVISFGRHNMFNVMPHVHVVTDEAQIPGYIDTALDPEFDRAAAQEQGKRYVAALREISFDMETMDTANTGRFSETAVEGAYRQLMRSMDMDMDNFVDGGNAANA